MEVDMQPIPLRATRSATKRARSPSSPGQYDRPSKRVSSGHDTSVPIAFPTFPTSPSSHGLPNPPVARLRNSPQDWVSQTQSMRLESPASEHSRFNTPMTDEGSEVRIDEAMADEPMRGDENSMSISPPRPTCVSIRGASPIPSQYLQPPDALYPSSRPALQPQNPNRLTIPAIQIQAATPSPVQMFAQPPPDAPPLHPSASEPTVAFDDSSMASPSSTLSPGAEFHRAAQTPAAASKRQRFTMGPRADCELCRMRVKGHYMHFD